MSDPKRLDEFIVALDALYARRETLVTRLDQLTQSEQHFEINDIQRECLQIDERIADLKGRLQKEQY